MKATDVVGYTFNANEFHPTCVLRALGYSKRTAETLVVEDELNELAGDRNIDRHDEHSFDSGDFPKVVFGSQLKACDEDGTPRVCGVCDEQMDPDYVRPGRWNDEVYHFWGPVPCNVLFDLFENSSEQPDGSYADPTVTHDEVVEHATGCAVCQDADVRVSTDVDGVGTLEWSSAPEED